MRFALSLAAALFVAAPVLAYETAAPALERAPKEGEVLRDAGGRQIGKVYKVQASGNILAIVNRETVRIPATTLSIIDGKLVTTLTKTEALKLR
ncbi:MAG: hypothetical protein JNL35_18955 [Sphingopyxis sp.]|nr:hypothetical protein [Sphingopyxis sp.]